MDGKLQEFWRQGDFGYVKKELDSMMMLCIPKDKVCDEIMAMLTHSISTCRMTPVFPALSISAFVELVIYLLTSGGLEL